MKEKEEEINLFDYLLVLLKRKNLIIGITLATAIVTAIISSAIKPIYKAETRILPPERGSSTELLSQHESPPIEDQNELYIGLLKSRTVLDRIIDRFDLMKLYNRKVREDVRKALVGALKASADKKSGIITIAVEDKDPKMAADLANAFVEELRTLTKELALTEASQRRLFYEEQLAAVKESLVKAEEAMRGFQEKTGALQMDTQARAVIESISNLRAQIAAKEVELKVMRTYSTPYNPDLQKAEEALRGLKAELRKLEAKGASQNPDPLMPTGRIPAVGTEYIRKLRELKFNETLYELLLKQYESARLDEAKDAPLIQVIDRAIPPEKKAKPKRMQMVTIATLTAFFFSILLAFLIEYKEKALNDPENRERFELLRRYTNKQKNL